MAISTQVYASDDTGNRGKQIRKAVVEKVTWNLNNVHTAEIAIHPLAPDALLVLLDEMELCILFNHSFNEPFQGVPKTTKGDFSKIVFTIESPITYMKDAFIIDTDRVNTGTEQMNIATGLVTYGQALSDQDRNITIGTYTGSGILRTRTYYAEEYKNIFEMLQEFPTLEDGFDWDVIIQPDGARKFTPYYPRKGSHKKQYKVWKGPSGASPFFKGLKNWSEDGQNQYTDQLVTGPVDSVTSLKLRGRWQAAAPEMTRFGRKQNVTADSGAVNQAWLDDEAAALGAFQVEPKILPDIVVSDSLFNLVVVGDSIPVRIDYGRIQVHGDYRIVQIEAPMDGTLVWKLEEV